MRHAPILIPMLALASLATGQTPAERAARVVIETHCLVCHGGLRTSGLDLRQRATMLSGGGRGPAIVPGKAGESLLYRAVTREGELKMPPGKEPLGAADLRALREWLDAGAPWEDAARKTADSSWWAFRPPVLSAVPVTEGDRWSRNPIDRFLLAALGGKGLAPAPEADRRTLIRRATFDLHGLPPDPAAVDLFVKDSSPDAYEKLIDGLLASPRYGERWGRHWLDVVRYADTGGYETDVVYANAWRYRDYVIASLNNDTPFDVFVQEQIAADEIWPDNLDLDGGYDIPRDKQANLHRRLGTGLYTIGPMAVEFTFFGDQFRAEWQAEAVDTTAAAMLGLTFACARCHDHKFDPVSQRDYYRLAAFFAGSEDREIPLVSRMGIYEHTRHLSKQWAVDQLKLRIQRLDADVRGRASRDRRARPPGSDYTPAERDLRESLLRRLGEAYMAAPAPYPTASVLGHSDSVPETHVLIRGDFRNRGERVAPGYPAALGGGEAVGEGVIPPGMRIVPERRKALARWLTAPEHPLLGRVMVNRIWQGHFGRGIVGTPNDFGRQGEPPTHPELLDWLAVEFRERGWSLKAMHRLMMTSSAYRMSSAANRAGLEMDPANRLLWRMNRRRLEAEAMRDAVLAASGSLNLKAGGPPVVVPLEPEEMSGIREAAHWPVTSDETEHARRSVYLYVKRSFRLPWLEMFDSPDAAQSCARREVSTVAPQALALLNGAVLQVQAERFAARLRIEVGENPEAWIVAGWRRALGREPSRAERERAREFLRDNPLPRLCLLLFNLNEFLYVD